MPRKEAICHPVGLYILDHLPFLIFDLVHLFAAVYFNLEFLYFALLKNKGLRHTCLRRVTFTQLYKWGRGSRLWLLINSLWTSPQFKLCSCPRGIWYHQLLDLCGILSVSLIGSLSPFSTFSLLVFPVYLALELLLFHLLKLSCVVIVVSAILPTLVNLCLRSF